MSLREWQRRFVDHFANAPTGAEEEEAMSEPKPDPEGNFPPKWRRTFFVRCTCCERDICYSTDLRINEVSRHRPQSKGADHYFCYRCDEMPRLEVPVNE